MARTIIEMIDLIKNNKISYITDEEWGAIHELVYTIAEALEPVSKQIMTSATQFNAWMRKALELELS